MIDPPDHLLFVCTANICRSPVAEMLLRHHIGDHAGVRVSSAGVRAHPELPVDKTMAGLLTADGIAVGDFGATEVDRAVLDRAGLVVTMTRQHRSSLVTQFPDVLARTFTLIELAALLEETGPATTWPEYAARRPLLSVAGEALDVADPYKRRRRVYARTYALIDSRVETIAKVLYGGQRGRS